jgi:hypothetical protein
MIVSVSPMFFGGGSRTQFSLLGRKSPQAGLYGPRWPTTTSRQWVGLNRRRIQRPWRSRVQPTSPRNPPFRLPARRGRRCPRPSPTARPLHSPSSCRPKPQGNRAPGRRLSRSGKLPSRHLPVVPRLLPCAPALCRRRRLVRGRSPHICVRRPRRACDRTRRRLMEQERPRPFPRANLRQPSFTRSEARSLPAPRASRPARRSRRRRCPPELPPTSSRACASSRRKSCGRGRSSSRRRPSFAPRAATPRI